MKVVILGAGVVGFQIAKNLINEGKDVIVIEKSSERSKIISNNLDCIVINGEGNNVNTLKRAGIKNADFFLSVTESDEINMIACGIVASEFNVPVKVARVRNLDYSKSKIFNKAFMGIDYTVNSEIETSNAIQTTVEHGASSDVLLFEKSSVQMRNIAVTKNSFFKDKTLIEIRQKSSEDFLITAIIRDDKVLIPYGNTVVKEDDNIYILAKKENMNNIFKLSGVKEQKIEKIVIVGGGNIGTLVAESLIKMGKNITIVDTDYSNCKNLSEKFSEALVINGDISDEALFEEEQLDKYDLIITATENQELNILASVYAKSLGTKRSIAMVTQSNYLKIASNLDIDATVSPKQSTVDAILKFVRKGNIKSVHSIFDGKAEVIEYLIDENSEIAQKQIKDIKLPKETLILSILRNGEDYIATGEFVIKPGDSVISITGSDSIGKLENLFIGKFKK